MNILPKFVAEAICKSAKYHNKAKEQQSIFETWIEVHYGEEVINDDSIRDTIIDCIEQSDDPEGAIKRIEEILSEYKK